MKYKLITWYFCFGYYDFFVVSATIHRPWQIEWPPVCGIFGVFSVPSPCPYCSWRLKLFLNLYLLDTESILKVLAQYENIDLEIMSAFNCSKDKERKQYEENCMWLNVWTRHLSKIHFMRFSCKSCLCRNLFIFSSGKFVGLTSWSCKKMHLCLCLISFS